MSILLVGLPDTLSITTIRRLIGQDDEVRILLDQGEPADPWRAVGAHVAFGDAADDDLAWRASTGVRTVVIGEMPGGSESLGPFLAGAERAGVSRVVVCLPQPPPAVVDALNESDLEYVVLTTASKPLLGRPKTKIPLSKLAEAIDAADDLSGRLRLELDLTVERSWQILKVLPDA